MRIEPAHVANWLMDNGYYGVSIGLNATVTLQDHDGDEGISLVAGTLTDACALADRLMREVPSADDVGAEECDRLLREWLLANDPGNRYLRGNDIGTAAND